MYQKLLLFGQFWGVLPNQKLLLSLMVSVLEFWCIKNSLFLCRVQSSAITLFLFFCIMGRNPQYSMFFVFLSWFDYFFVLWAAIIMVWLINLVWTIICEFPLKIAWKILEISLKNPQNFPWKSLKFALKILEIYLRIFEILFLKTRIFHNVNGELSKII